MGNNIIMVKLTVEQITQLWDLIRFGLIQSISPMVAITDDNIKSIFCSLLEDQMQCWSVYDDAKDIYGHIITAISKEVNTGEKTLVIYSLYLDKGVRDKDVWLKSFDSLNEFAKANGCVSITAFSSSANVISIAEKFGFSSEYRYLTKEVT